MFYDVSESLIIFINVVSGKTDNSIHSGNQKIHPNVATCMQISLFFFGSMLFAGFNIHWSNSFANKVLCLKNIFKSLISPSILYQHFHKAL